MERQNRLRKMIRRLLGVLFFILALSLPTSLAYADEAE